MKKFKVVWQRPYKNVDWHIFSNEERATNWYNNIKRCGHPAELYKLEAGKEPELIERHEGA